MDDDSPGEKHISFMHWAISQGIQINGIAPARFPGRRLGMVATRTIEVSGWLTQEPERKENETILTVPVSAMLTIDSIPPSFVEQFPENTPVQGILASFLTCGDTEVLKNLDSWRKVLPSRSEFEECMPILWPEHLRRSNSAFQTSGDTAHSSAGAASLLPPSASGLWNSMRKTPVDVPYESRYQNLLAQQENRLQQAWKSVLSVFPDMDWDKFSLNWLILNTRSFYYVAAGEKRPEDWNDAIGLVPFADYFNHSDAGDCEVTYDAHEYAFKAVHRYEKGDEIFATYGSHSNDFLLVEYGFYLDENKSDGIYLDDIIFRELGKAEKEELKSRQYLGNYEVTSAGACYRTEVAACMKYMTRKDWRNYVLGHSTRGMDAKKTANFIRGWIGSYLKETQVAIAILEEMLAKKSQAAGDVADAAGAGPEGAQGEKEKIAMLVGRWKQIKRLCEDALSSTG